MAGKYISGQKNEEFFSAYLNDKEFGKLGDNASKFIKQLYPDIADSTTIHALKVGGMGLKPDVKVLVEGDETNISIKKGRGNSVHQEKTSLFLLYCKDYLNMDEETRNCFLAYLYGDGTLDGKGRVEDRLEGNDLYEKYGQEIKIIHDFLLKNCRPLIERFLVYGRRGKELNIKADYLFHGQINDGIWCPLDETVDFLVEKAKQQANSDTPTIGPLTLQTWNRNLKGSPKLEDRRDSIQIKWGSKILKYIAEINNKYLEKIKNSPTLAKPRYFGDNSHGFSNAREIATGLNGCRVRNLRGALLGLINTIFTGNALTDVISCELLTNSKPDIKITIGENNVSIFLGESNSVHQENFLEFLDFCRSKFQMNKEVENALRFIYYGDGTTDGSGKVEDRLKDSSTIKRLYPDKVSIAQDFFDHHRRDLAKRFLVTGKYTDKPEADYVFHGNVENGISISYDSVLDYIESFNGKRNGLLSIGPLSFQMWNRNLSGNKDKEYKRESIQIKWPSMPKRIKEAYAFLKSKEERSKIEGINAEYELVSLLNKNRNNHNPLWVELKNRLNLPANDIYAIRVSRQVHSNFLEQTIYPKSDLYLCKARIDENKLDEFGYVLDEDIIKKDKIFIEPINESGISCNLC